MKLKQLLLKNITQKFTKFENCVGIQWCISSLKKVVKIWEMFKFIEGKSCLKEGNVIKSVMLWGWLIAKWLNSMKKYINFFSIDSFLQQLNIYIIPGIHIL